MTADDSLHGNGHRRGIRFDPTINLGHVGTMCASLLMIGMAWANLDTRVVQGAKQADEMKAAIATKADKETVGKGEVELSRRITEQQAVFNAQQFNTAQDIRDIKTLIREIDAKLDRKADKPGR